MNGDFRGKGLVTNDVQFLLFSRRIVRLSSSKSPHSAVVRLRGTISPRHRFSCGPTKADAIFGCGSQPLFEEDPSPGPPSPKTFGAGRLPLVAAGGSGHFRGCRMGLHSHGSLCPAGTGLLMKSSGGIFFVLGSLPQTPFKNSGTLGGSDHPRSSSEVGGAISYVVVRSGHDCS